MLLPPYGGVPAADVNFGFGIVQGATAFIIVLVHFEVILEMLRQQRFAAVAALPSRDAVFISDRDMGDAGILALKDRPDQGPASGRQIGLERGVPQK